MEQSIQDELTFSGSAWPARLGGIIIFIITLVIYFSSSGIKIFFPIVAAIFMIIAIIFSADIVVKADKIKQILTVEKKRILNSTYTVYSFSEIVYLRRNTSFSTNTDNKQEKRVKYTIAIKGRTLAMEKGGYVPIAISIPSVWYAMFSPSFREVQEFAHARELAAFIGVPLYEKGGENDMLVNAIAVAPKIMETIKGLPDIFAKAKEENDKTAREVLGDKYPN